MKRPITAVMKSGTSRFTPGLLLSVHPLGQPMDVEGFERAADENGRDDAELEHVRALETTDQSRLAGEVGAGGEQLLTDQRVVAGDDEERQLGDLRRPRHLD